MPEVGLKDYFKEHMWSLKPNGCDYNKAYEAFAKTIEEGYDEIEGIHPTKEILVERHDFSEDRVNKQLDKLRDAEEKAKQKDLDKWF